MNPIKVEFIGGPYDGQFMIIPDDTIDIQISTKFDFDDESVDRDNLVIEGKYAPNLTDLTLWYWTAYE